MVQDGDIDTIDH